MLGEGRRGEDAGGLGSIVGLSGRGGQNGKLEAGGVPFHAGVFDRREGAGQFDGEIGLVPGFFADGLDFGEGVAEAVKGFGHLLDVAAGAELGFFEEADAAGKGLNDFLAAGLEFELAAAGFFEGGAFAFEFFLVAFEFGEALLGFGDFGVDFLACGGARAGRR